MFDTYSSLIGKKKKLKIRWIHEEFFQFYQIAYENKTFENRLWIRRFRTVNNYIKYVNIEKCFDRRKMSKLERLDVFEPRELPEISSGV